MSTLNARFNLAKPCKPSDQFKEETGPVELCGTLYVPKGITAPITLRLVPKAPKKNSVVYEPEGSDVRLSPYITNAALVALGATGTADGSPLKPLEATLTPIDGASVELALKLAA